MNHYSYLDLEKPWWNQSATKELQIGNRLYFVTGDITKSMVDEMFVYTFNQKVADDLGIESLYDVVNEHRWTIDYVYTLVDGLYTDLNGDGQADIGDKYGLSTACSNPAVAYVNGFRLTMLTRNNDGNLYFDIDKERMADVVNKVYSLYWENPGTLGATLNGTDMACFMEDRALLGTFRFKDIRRSFGDMESDYGVLPYPLFDENQKEYGTRVKDPTLMCIPVDAIDPEMSVAVLEALATESYAVLLLLSLMLF